MTTPFFAFASLLLEILNRCEMKNLIIVLVGLLIGGFSNLIYSQENRHPFVVSRFIGEKLDRVEEEYFKIFPALSDFQEAIFYINPDSLLDVHIKASLRETHIDTTILYDHSLTSLRNRISQTILKDMSQSNVQELKIITDDNKEYNGTAYSFDNKQIKFIKKEFAGLRNNSNQEKYLQTINYSKVHIITVRESNAPLTFFVGLLGAITGGVIAGILAPTPDPFWLKLPNYEKTAYVLLGGVIGRALGYLIGNSIKLPVDYYSSYSEAKDIINENSLLPNGLAK
jgi:hypothetical protein